MFIPTSYFFNPQALPLFVVGFFMLFGGLFVFSRNRHSKTNISFLLICISVNIWLLATAMGYLCKDEIIAAMWFKCDNFGVMFISVNVYFFVSSFVGLPKRKKSIIIGYIVAFILGTIAISTNLLVKGVKKHFWGYFPEWGILSIPALTMFFGYMAASFLTLMYCYKKATSPLQRNQIKYIFLAFLGAYTGSVDYLPTFGIEIYPFGYISIAVFLSIVAYAIVKFRLMDINIFISRAVVFFVVYGVLLILPLSTFFSSKSLLTQILLGPDWWLLPFSIAIYAFLASIAPFIYMRIQKRVEDILLAEQRRYQETLRKASQGMTLIKDLNKLSSLIVHILTKAIRVTHASAYVLDEPNNQYVLKAIRGLPKRDVALSIDADESLIKVLSVRRLPLTFDELKRYLQETTTIYTRFDLERTNKKMRSLNAAIVIPSFIQKKLLGFVILGDKKAGAIYTSDDIVIFSVLANQAALAIENCQFFEQQQRAQVKMFESEKLTSMGKMASGMSHQVNNRFFAVSGLADLGRLTYVPILIQLLTTEEQKKAAKGIEDLFTEINQNAIQGGDITKGLMDFVRPSQEGFKEVSIPTIIEGALKMVSIKDSLAGIDITKDVPTYIPSVFGDLTQLQDALFNLLDNAVDATEINKFKMNTDEIPQKLNYKPQITIKVTQEDKSIAISIQDNGIGMTKEELNQIFNPFFTTKATSVKGTGLGLFVIRKILETHNGTVEVTSKYTEGTTFTVRLPVSKEKTND